MSTTLQHTPYIHPVLSVYSNMSASNSRTLFGLIGESEHCAVFHLFVRGIKGSTKEGKQYFKASLPMSYQGETMLQVKN